MEQDDAEESILYLYDKKMSGDFSPQDKEIPFSQVELREVLNEADISASPSEIASFYKHDSDNTLPPKINKQGYKAIVS